MQKEIMAKYMAGINLGGWISQCRYEREHIAGFIHEADIAQIASWGIDHIRLPFDYPVLEDDNQPFQYLEDGFAVIDKLIGWCNKHKLNVVLDMHKAPGYAFYDDADKQSLFTSAETQKRFISIWEEMSRRYKAERDNVLFELMNEITDPRGDTWNKIARAAIDAIHAIDPGRYILLGGPHYNSAAGLATLDIYDDEHILYNFHFYEPFLFTHQRASWTPLKGTDIHQPYPGKVEGAEVLKDKFPPMAEKATEDETIFDKAHLLEKLAPALDFMKKTGKSLYCGEYGAIDLADMDSRVNWLQDVSALFKEHGIGRAYWSYKGMSFSTIDRQGHPVSDALTAAIAAK